MIKKRLQRRRFRTQRTNPKLRPGASESGGNNFEQLSASPADLF